MRRGELDASTESMFSQEVTVAHLKALAHSSDVTVDDSIGAVPALVLLPKVFLIGIVPTWVRLLIPVLLAGGAFVSDPHSDRRTFERLSPVSTSALVTAKAISIMVLSFAALVAVATPTVVAALLQNGLGDLSYPTVVSSAGASVGIAAISSGHLLALYLVQFTLSVLLVTAAAFLISRFSNSRGAVLAGLVILAAVPTAFETLRRSVPLEVLRYVPPVYMEPMYAIGHPAIMIGSSVWLGLPVLEVFGILATTTAALIATGGLLVRLKRGW